MKRISGFGIRAGVLAACAMSLTSAPSACAQRLSLTVAPGGEAARMTSSRDGYRLTLPVTLRATIAAGGEGYRITAARLVIKDEGKEASAGGSGAPVGADAWIAAETFAYEAAAQATLTQNAKAACAASARQQTSMLVPVVWHVETGQFGFVRLAAQGLQPTVDMLSDAGFYGDKQEEQVEAAIAVTIDCPPETSQLAASSPAPVQSPKASAKAKPKLEMAAVKSDEPEAVQANATAGVQAFTCEGGMVRETLAGPGYEVCLCPGNTARRQTGERAFSCEKRFARKR